MNVPAIGQRIRITSTRATGLLKPGDVVTVGETFFTPGVPEIWITTGSRKQGQDGERFGWVTWEPVDEEEVVTLLRAAGVYNDAEPLVCSVKRLLDERASERKRAERHQTAEAAACIQVRDHIKRIARLESEILRLSTPPGSPIGWNGKEGPQRHPNPLPEVAAPDPDRSRIGRQRRELRRLNQRLRFLALQLDRQEHVTESVLQDLLATRAALRIAQVSK